MNASIPRTANGELGSLADFAGSSPNLRRHLRHSLVRLIWTHREISRAELARLTGLSRSTISSIVGEILAAGLVKETREGVSRGGRKPILLGFQNDFRLILGFEVGASHLGGVLLDLQGQVLDRRYLPCSTRQAPAETLASIREVARELIGDRERPLLGIGLAMPAPVEPSTGRPSTVVLPAWAGIDLRASLSTTFGCPVYVDNDANLGALAEQWWGEGKDGENLAFVKVATGIGAGLIIDGKILKGHQGFAGELGHLSTDPDGPPCICGGNGCLNVVIGTGVLLERAKARSIHFPDSLMHQLGFDLEGLVTATHRSDPLATEIVRYAGEKLGLGLASLLNVLDPSVIVLGGDIVQTGEALLEVVRRTASRRTLVKREKGPRIVASQVDRQSVALGAGTLILQKALEGTELSMVAEWEVG